MPAHDTSDNSAEQDCHHTACLVYEFGWCTEIRRRRAESGHHGSDGQVQTIPARRMVFHPNEWYEFVPIICQGWAAYSIVGGDGRRQILSFRLPGDIISMAWLRESISVRSIEAVTPVTYRKFERKSLIAMLSDIPRLWEKLLQSLTDELDQTERLAYAIGRRRADERVARLILHLSEKLAGHGMAQGQTIEFPLRQRDIADATGLTHDHVNKVLGSFQRDNLIKIDGRSLTILDQPKLRSMASHP